MANSILIHLLSICARSYFGIVIATLISIFFAVAWAWTIYALYLHPLAKYPGPLCARLTQWYDVYHAYIGDKHVNFYHLHQRYGKVVRYSPNKLSINDPDALKAIHAHGANVQKSTFYKCFRSAPGAISTLLATEKTHHARKRRVMGQAFSNEALRGLEQYVLGHVEDLVDRIGTVIQVAGADKQQWSTKLDMSKYLNWLVFDIMGDLVFGKSFGTLGEKPENREGIRLLGRAARRNYTVAAMPALAQYGFEKWLPGLRSLYLDRLKYLAFGKAQVQGRMKDKGFGETGRTDIFSFLLHAKDPQTGGGFPLPELFMEGNTLIVAGSDTSSTSVLHLQDLSTQTLIVYRSMATVLYYLLNDPKILAHMEREIRSIFKSAAEIQMNDQMQKCCYLRACIDESMRMTPAVPGLLPREVLRGGLSIPSLGMHLPEGVEVGVPIYAIHHNAAYVDEPFGFNPDRWLHQDDRLPEHRQNKEALNAVFCPFLLGPRSCLGKPLVYMELSIAIARLVWEFDMRPAPVQAKDYCPMGKTKEESHRPQEYQVRDYFLSNNDSVMVQFRARSL